MHYICSRLQIYTHACMHACMHMHARAHTRTHLTIVSAFICTGHLVTIKPTHIYKFSIRAHSHQLLAKLTLQMTQGSFIILLRSAFSPFTVYKKEKQEVEKTSNVLLVLRRESNTINGHNGLLLFKSQQHSKLYKNAGEIKFLPTKYGKYWLQKSPPIN